MVIQGKTKTKHDPRSANSEIVLEPVEDEDASHLSPLLSLLSLPSPMAVRVAVITSCLIFLLRATTGR